MHYIVLLIAGAICFGMGLLSSRRKQEGQE